MPLASKLWFVRRVRVEGLSMVPTLAPGALVTALWRWRPLHDGDIVVIKNPRDTSMWLIKRCHLVAGRQVSLLGDNEAVSTDSRVFGTVARRRVRWLVVRTFASSETP